MDCCHGRQFYFITNNFLKERYAYKNNGPVESTDSSRILPHTNFNCFKVITEVVDMHHGFLKTLLTIKFRFRKVSRTWDGYPTGAANSLLHLGSHEEYLFICFYIRILACLYMTQIFFLQGKKTSLKWIHIFIRLLLVLECYQIPCK